MQQFKNKIIVQDIPPYKILGLIMLVVVFVGCSPALKFARVQYPASEINKILDNADVRYLTIQYKTQNAGTYKEPFTLVSYPRDSNWGYVDSAYELGAASGTKPATFKGKTVMGNITVEKDSLVSLLTTNGRRITDFSYLLFTPRHDADYNYIYYDITVVVPKEQTMVVASYAARPCPPATNCPATPGP